MTQEAGNKSVNIGAVGDICPGDKAIMGLGVLRKTLMHGAGFPFDGVRHALNNFDLLVGNFEGVLSAGVAGERPVQLTFCGQPKFAEALAEAGFHVLNIANNHTMEHGSEILLETVNYLRGAGIEICGLRSSSEEFFSEPVIITRNGISIGVLGYNWIGTKKHKGADAVIAQVHDGIVNYSWDRDPSVNETLREKVALRNVNVMQDIKALRVKVDIVILMPHWGYEYVYYPPQGVVYEARSFIDAGVDLIIGTHPHVIQGGETYKGGLVCYSLGNFIFDMREREMRHSMLLDVDYTSRSQFSYRQHSIVINRNFQPKFADPQDDIEIAKIIDDSNKKIAAVNELSNNNELDDEVLYGEYVACYKKRKINTILNHFIAVKEDYRVIYIIFEKMLTFFKVMIANLKGEKIRW